jgi:oligoendopeptidase F
VFRLKLTIVLLALTVIPVHAQEHFEPFPNGSAALYHIDLTRIFASPDAERADRSRIRTELAALQALRGHVTSSGGNLLRALQMNDALQMRVARHAMYLYLRYAMDTRDEKSRDESDALGIEAEAGSAFLRQEVLHLSDRRLAAMMKASPRLQTYRYAIESIRRWRMHTLSEPEEKALDQTEPLGLQWQFDLYERLLSRVPPGRPTTEEAFRKRWEAFASERDLFAFTLMRLAASRNAFAHLRHFDDAVQWSYFGRQLTRPGVTSLLGRLANGAETYKRYQQLRADHVRKTMGHDETMVDVNVWDLSAEPVFNAPHFTIDEAREIIVEATSPLGKEYGVQIAALLDPANGRMDVVAGPHRKSGGFSEGTIGTDSVFFSGGFSGSYDNVRVLMHESTHAVQRQLMTAAHVPMAYARGPNYLAEALAIFNELVLADFMASRAKTSAERVFYLQQFLDGKGMIAFVVAPEAELEEAVYDGVAAGTIHGADDLDALTKRVYDRYSIWPAKHDDLKRQWMAVPLMYEDPFYDLNYVYGGIIALRMYSMYTKDPASFAQRYVAMMRNGYTAPASTLLEGFFGIDLNDPQLVTDVVAMLDARVEQLRAAYERP